MDRSLNPAETKALEPWKWTPKRERAAQMLAEDVLTDAGIGSQVGCTDRAIRMWKTYPEFQARIQSELAKIIRRTENSGRALRHKRIQALDKRCTGLDKVIEARAKVYNRPEIPGGDTGLVAVEFKSARVTEQRVVDGKTQFVEISKLIPEYPVDTGLLRELREHEKQIAVEMGQWDEGIKAGGDVNVTVTYQHLDTKLTRSTVIVTNGNGHEQEHSIGAPATAPGTNGDHPAIEAVYGSGLRPAVRQDDTGNGSGNPSGTEG